MKDKWISITKAAEIFGVSRDKIKRLIRDGLIGVNEAGRICFDQIKDALTEDKKLKERFKRSMLIYRRERAKLAELKRKELEGKLIRVDKVINTWGRVALSIKKKLLLWPSKLPPLLEGKNRTEIAKIFDQELKDIFEELEQVNKELGK